VRLDERDREGLGVQIWNVLAADATGKTDPRVLFSTPEARMVMIDLAEGEELGDHEVHERAIMQVARGTIELTCSQGATTCTQGAVVLFEPGERHAVRASEAARILLTLAPWPGQGHYDPSETQDPHRLPAHATALHQS
jgi:quercetin dioxygenase-like cupin family protein